jgi:hypothetical protein
VHFIISYDLNNLKRDSAELQRLEVTFKDSLEYICSCADIEDEDKLQSFGTAISRFTRLLKGADDLEMMSIRLSEVIDDLKVLSTDFNNIKDMILRKFDEELNRGKQQLLERTRECRLLFSRSFECNYKGNVFHDVVCIDGDLYVAFEENGTLLVNKNNDHLMSISGPVDQVHIASSLVILVVKNSCLFALFKDKKPLKLADGLQDKVIISGRYGLVVVQLDRHTFHTFDLKSMS